MISKCLLSINWWCGNFSTKGIVKYLITQSVDLKVLLQRELESVLSFSSDNAGDTERGFPILRKKMKDLVISIIRLKRMLHERRLGVVYPHLLTCICICVLGLL